MLIRNKYFLGFVFGFVNGGVYFLIYRNHIRSYEQYRYELDYLPEEFEYWNHDHMNFQ